MRQLFCGGLAGATAKTVTAPFSRLTILYQVHSLVTTKEHRPRFSMTLQGGFAKIVERGGIWSLWRGNGTSVLHRFPYSAINFFIYENTFRLLSKSDWNRQYYDNHNHNTTNHHHDDDDDDATPLTRSQLVRRVTSDFHTRRQGRDKNDTSTPSPKTNPAIKFLSGAIAGSVACIACYPLDLVRTRLTTELEGREHYKGMVDAFQKIYRKEGWRGYYSGLPPTLLVAVPNFAISYTVYGTLKEHVLDDELFYSVRKIEPDNDNDAQSQNGPRKLGFWLTLLCGSTSGALSTLITYPFDTVRRRMQIQNLHIPETERMSAWRQGVSVVQKEGMAGLYRGLTPELLKVIPMVGTMFVVYEFSKEKLGVDQ